MTAQKVSSQINQFTTGELKVRIEKAVWVLVKTDDARERTVILSVLEKLKAVLDERMNNINGQICKSVIIWKQIWMAENLNVGHFRNGEEIHEAKTSLEWETAGRNREPVWCYYENDPANGRIYGKLYNWYAVADPRNVAPAGWHIPTLAEWRILLNDKGDENSIGGELKEKGTSHWKEPNHYASDIHGFKALPGGYQEDPARFYTLGTGGNWWTTTECHPIRSWSVNIQSIYGSLIFREGMKSSGYSVRCVRD
jgi:uncharacterized protein (TIGR02145 family)